MGNFPFLNLSGTTILISISVKTMNNSDSLIHSSKNYQWFKIPNPPKRNGNTVVALIFLIWFSRLTSEHTISLEKKKLQT